MTSPIRVLIVDDQALVRIGLRSLLSPSAGFHIVGEARTAGEAIRLNARTRPDIVLMDVRLPGGSGLEACCRMTADHPGVRVLVLTSHCDGPAVIGAVMAGVSGYLLMEAPAERLVEAIREAAAGETALDSRAARVLLDHVRDLSDRLAETEVAGLTHRERRILALIAEGYTNRAIGEVLHLSPKTIANQASRLFEKLGVRRRSQAAAWAGQRRRRLSPDARV